MSQKTKEEKKMDTFERWELKEAVLGVLGASLIVGGSIAFPTMPIIASYIIRVIQGFKKTEVSPKKIKRVLKSLEKKELIVLEEKGNEIFVHLKEKEHESILKYSLKTLLDFKKKEKKWNRKWILLFFDVPEKQRTKRDYLRKFLLQLGFYPYQKSVYLFPYECEKEITLIKKIVEGGKYVKYIIAEKIEDESLAKNFFKL